MFNFLRPVVGNSRDATASRPSAPRPDKPGRTDKPRLADKPRLGVLILSLLAGCGATAHAETFYEGKTIKILVGFAPGGGYDTYARLLARHLGRHVPGTPSVIVQNMPGAGSLKAVSYLDVGAPTDGTVITTFNPGLITQSVIAPETVGVDFRNFAWIGNVSEDIRVCFVWHTKAADARSGKELIFGATTPGTLGYIEARILNDYLNIPLRLVQGYPGSAEKRLAVENGELDGDCGGWVNIPPHWLAENKIQALVRFSKSHIAGLEAGTPYVGDLIRDHARRKTLDLLIAPEEIGRPFLASSSVPQKRLKMLRSAFDQTMVDPAFIADAARMNLTVTPMGGDAVQERLSEIYDATTDSVVEAKRISGQK
jgi:tripartite-type tricarboxylate transporter receptor subunit TctC